MSKKRGEERRRKQQRAKKQSDSRGDWIRASHAPPDLFEPVNLLSRPIADSDKVGPATTDAKYAQLTPKVKYLSLIEQTKALFKISYEDGEFRMHREPDASSVKQLAEQVANSWPRDWKPEAYPAGNGFNVLFWGDFTPNSILNTITRASLYADRILVANPFINSLFFHPQHSPLVKPEAWTAPYALHAAFLAMLEPWIQADIVTVIENPVFFDAKLYHATKAKAKERFARDMDGKSDAEWLHGGLDLMADWSLLLAPADRQLLLETSPLSPKEKARVEARIAELTKTDPIRASLPFSPKHRQILHLGSGMSYEATQLIIAQHGAHLLTNDEEFAQIMANQASEMKAPFHQAAQAFSKVKLDFLNNVSADFAIGLRKDGRLRDFRQYLTTLAKGVQFRSADGALQPSSIVEFSERFEAEYARYREEWSDIQRKLGAKALGIGVVTGVTAAAAAAVVPGLLPILGSFGTGLAAELYTLFDAVFDRRKLDRQPLGLVLRLDKRM